MGIKWQRIKIPTGFKPAEYLLNHSGNHNDTIVTVCKKIK